MRTRPARARPPPPPSRLARARRAPLGPPPSRSRRRRPTRLPTASRPRSAAAKPPPKRPLHRSRTYDCWGHAMWAPIRTSNDPAACRSAAGRGRAQQRRPPLHGRSREAGGDGERVADASNETLAPVVEGYMMGCAQLRALPARRSKKQSAQSPRGDRGGGGGRIFGGGRPRAHGRGARRHQRRSRPDRKAAGRRGGSQHSWSRER